MLEVSGFTRRRAATQILDAESDVEDEDLIAREDMVVTVSHAGYIKRVPLSTYRAQRRGGKAARHANEGGDFVHRSSSPTRTRRCCSSPRWAAAYKEGMAAAARAPQARGKALSTCCRSTPASASRHHAAARDEASWATLRRDLRDDARHGAAQQLSDFSDVRRNALLR